MYLLTLPSLDHLLRNPHTGKLKTKFVFVVDNGPSEAPSSPLVQMLMVRMLKFLKLEKCTTVSNAEFNSKMNPGERPHAEENRVLSCHGPYSSKLVHGNAVVGSKEHLQNMEAMAREVSSTIKEATFGGKKLEAYRGITDADYVFRDEETLKVFLSLSEQNKEEFEETYSPSFSSSILESIARNWNIDKNYSSSYVDDYEHLNNTLKQDERTSWIEKYRAVFYNSAECINFRRYEFQPVPDYVCWARTQELHYLPLSLMKELSFGPWSQEAGLFLPTRILSMLMPIFPDPEAQLIHFFSFFFSVSEEKVKEFLKQSQEKLDDEMFEEKLRDQWKDHKLYKKTKEELEKDALALGIEVSKASKARLVERIANKKHIEEPPFIEYNGNLRSVPNNLTELSKLSTSVLRRILKYHNITTSGKKDELVIRVFLLRNNRSYLCCYEEEQAIEHLLQVAEDLIFEEQSLYLNRDYQVTHTQRRFSSFRNKVSLGPKVAAGTQETARTKLDVPQHIDEGNLNEMIKEIRTALHQKKSALKDLQESFHGNFTGGKDQARDGLEAATEVGTKVKIKLDKTMVQNKQPGWFHGEVQGYQRKTDKLTVFFKSINWPIKFDLTEIVAKGRIQVSQ